ncbi:MAG TPA: 2-hydroxychromene-2-carboxylate isomerase [Burkholderiaceae bacterium]|nr:2-hydroxychromene-2-carboxylate isomerase [Burkholderiaceae bacterium]
MKPRIEFYFDFSSPYSYVAANLIEGIADKHRATLAWRPVLLGVAFKASGQRPLVEIPVKGDYSRRDFERTARFHGLAFRYPTTFPISTVNTARAVLWLQAQGSAKTATFIRRAMRAYYVEDRAINDPATIAELASELGIDAAAVSAGIQDGAIKDKLKADVDEAIARGVFGAPFIFVDGEPFWGHDRLPQVERWLATGPF